MSPLPTAASRPKTLSDLVKHETDPLTGRRTGVLLAGSGAARAIALGTLVAVLNLGTPTVAAKAGGNAANTGLLTLDVTTPLRPGAKQGVYAVRCIAAAANSGTFRVEDPDGNVLGDVAVGVTFDDDVKFVIADGAQDFIVGEGFDITVPAGNGKLVAWSPTGVGGAEVVAGIALNEVTAADGVDAVDPVLYLRRDALVVSSEIAWPDGISAGDKALALAALERLGIKADPAW